MSEHASVADVGQGGEVAYSGAALPAESVGMPAPMPSFSAMQHQYHVHQPVSPESTADLR